MSTAIPYAAAFLAIILVLWTIDTLRLKAAAKRIDASFRKLSREPQWITLEPQAFDANVLARLNAWDALCREQFGFRPLVRLQEQYANGECLGVRTVLINEDQNIVATFACSHRDARISFRSFISIVDEKLLMATDAKSISLRPAHHIVAPFDKSASEVAMLEKLTELRNEVPGNPKRIRSAEEYISIQQSMWRDKNAIREKNHYIVDVNALRKLAPANLSEARLRRIHRYIAKLHQ